MNKYRDLDMFFGNLMIYKNNEFKIFMEKASFVYNEDGNYFLLYDNEIINYFESILDNKENALVGFEEAYEKRKFSITPKKEENYIFIDETSLVNLDSRKGKNR